METYRGLQPVKAQRWCFPVRLRCPRNGHRGAPSVVVPRAAYGENPTSDPDNYVAMGLATCFEQVEEGRLEEKHVIEPLAATSLECMANGAQTSFRVVTGLTLKDALDRDLSCFPEEFRKGIFCEDYVNRCAAAARTWTRNHAQDNLMDIVPLGQIKDNFNYNLQHKRVMNFENIVKDDDNIKQDMSIDVYGRKKDEEYAKKLEQEQEPTLAEDAEEEEEDEEEEDLDSLLLG